MASEEYTIIVDGEKFVLTRDQLLSDPRNYFATYFLGDFGEARAGRRELVLSKEPLIFKLIHTHLRGYDVFPIPDSLVPSYMTKEGVVKNLLRDARFFGLELLEQSVLQEMESLDYRNTTNKRKIYMLAEGRGDTHVNWHIQEVSEPGFQLLLQRFKDEGFYAQIRTTPGLDIPAGFSLRMSWKSVRPHHDSVYALLESKP
ncbi:hypothetical protein PIIN_09523 [Serendipita indica DSM 11827]|uniref:BTB domain-containing protein n=1 Tax=Serendipita indica (strain DSM 11827) TaxID=1109443 RepID=G4U350_SERID|nr:hypothetical protein PIIN_09523 [Serendipita indica DSM 11827]